jgi:hypothetical protein
MTLPAGILAGVYKLTKCLVAIFLRRKRYPDSSASPKEKVVPNPHAAYRGGMWPGLSGGFLAGLLAILTQDRRGRRTLALYAAARLVQCIYNWLKEEGRLTPLKHGDAALFILSSAQIMYAYVMRRPTLHPSFLKFITETGPVHPTVCQIQYQTILLFFYCAFCTK